MPIFKGLFHSRDKPKNALNGSAFSFLFGSTTSGKNVNERSAMQLTAVYACVRILSEAIASLPLHLYRYNDTGGKEKALDHRLYTLLHDEPNPEMTSFIFREVMMTHLLLWGNAYAQVLRNGKGEIIGLYRKVNNRHSCEGPSTYVVHRIEDVVIDAVRKFFERLRLQPDETLLASVKDQDSTVTDNAVQRVEAELEAASKAMKALEAEAMKALTGEGGLDITMVNQMLPKCRERIETAQREYERVCKAAEEANAAEANRTEEIAMMRSWADTFDTASLDAKRMVVAALVERIEVRRGYDITIKFRLTEAQFFEDMVTGKSA